MKKIVMLFVALITTISISAQIYVGGNLGFSSSKLSTGESSMSGTSYKFQPEVGYQLNDRFAVGINLGVSKGLCALGSFNTSDLKGLLSTVVGGALDIYSSSDNKSSVSLKGFNVNPYVRYTAYKNKYIDIFVDGTIGYSNIKASMGDEGASYKINSFEIALKPGIDVKVSEKLKLVAKAGFLGYQQLKLKDTDYKVTRFGADVDTSNLLFGINYAF